MRERQKVWAVVLAAGDGTRLATLTTDANGTAVPKQFCSLNGGGSLLHEALERARRIASHDRVCAIVAEKHRPFWRHSVVALAPGNVIEQPSNRGTANGILLAVLTILERDPLARIVFLPADHYVSDERTLAESLRIAATPPTRKPDGLVLVGIEPEAPDPELGYIVPGQSLMDGFRAVYRFVEKPDPRLARDLVAAGAVWNSFIFATSGPALLGMLRSRIPAIVEEMATALARDACIGPPVGALAELYERLPSVDFSRAIVQGAESTLRVITARACGWTDLGTPQRVIETLRRLEEERLERAASLPRHGASHQTPAFINLAVQHARLSLVS